MGNDVFLNVRLIVAQFEMFQNGHGHMLEKSSSFAPVYMYNTTPLLCENYINCMHTLMNYTNGFQLCLTACRA